MVVESGRYSEIQEEDSNFDRAFDLVEIHSHGLNLVEELCVVDSWADSRGYDSISIFFPWSRASKLPLYTYQV